MEVKVIKKTNVKQFKDCGPGFYIFASHIDYQSPTVFKVMTLENKNYYCSLNNSILRLVTGDKSEMVEVEIKNVEIVVN